MKILLHAHTTFSNDGELTIDELGKAAKRRGFDAVFVTEHFEDLNESKFEDLKTQCHAVTHCLMIPGYERSWNEYHVLALGLKQWIVENNITVWSQKVHLDGALLVMAHPIKYLFKVPREILEVCDFVEIWNSRFAYDGILGPDPRSAKLLNPCRRPICGQDIHKIRNITSLGLILPIKDGCIKDILDCIKKGTYQMTNGILTYDANYAPSVFSAHLLIAILRRPFVTIISKGYKYLMHYSRVHATNKKGL